jgi:hypothetical protein
MFDRNRAEAARDELPVRRVPYDYSGGICHHTDHGVWVDPDKRVVTCRGCAAELDPISVLAGLAHRYEALVDAGLTRQHEVQRLTKAVAQLTRAEKNAKARVRAARRRADDREGLIAAAKAVQIGGYRSWDELNEHQQGEVVRRVEVLVEAYFGAMADYVAAR